MTTTTTTTSTQALPMVRVTSLAASLIGALFLGAVLVFGTGFSPSQAGHNAAHDMRHANGFPCH
jgi:cobalt transporter subunit CbtB